MMLACRCVSGAARVRGIIADSPERSAVLRSLISLVIGALIGFATAALAIFAGVLLATGVGGGILARRQPGTARVLGYDPSHVVEKSLHPGAAALILLAIFILIARRMGRRG
jgi:hypothetical protein